MKKDGLHFIGAAGMLGGKLTNRCSATRTSITSALS
jgi:hypothetical protein